MNKEVRKKIEDRIAWLKDKQDHMRSPSSPDYTPVQLLIGRVQGEIGGLEWLLKELSQ